MADQTGDTSVHRSLQSDPGARVPSAGGRPRRGHLDWMRGLAVLIMIEAHLIDSWTGAPDREGALFRVAMIVGGMGAPLFLFLAGLSVSMSAGSKFRRSGDSRSAGRAVARRGLQIFGLAFLFRIQAWILGWSSPRALLKVDILNIMGPSIMVAAALWRAVDATRARAALFVAATVAVALLTPILRDAPVVVALPAPLEAYFRPVPGLTNFVFLPWMAFVFAGAIPGLLIDMAGTREAETRVIRRLAVVGALVASAGLTASYLPSPYEYSYFWTTSPAFFFIRAGAMTLAIPVAYLWECRAGGATRWSPVRQIGRTSLFIYWIHVEMVYGLISLPLHKALTLAQALVAFGLFTGVMLVCSVVKDRLAEAWACRKLLAVPQKLSL